MTAGSRFVQTDSGNKGARSFGMAEAPTPVKKSVEFLVATVRLRFSSLAFLGIYG